MINVYIIGAGKHAAEISEYLGEKKEYNLEGYIINMDGSFNHPSISKSVITLTDFIYNVPPSPSVKIIGAIGDFKRKSIIKELEERGYEFINIIQSFNYISPSLIIGIGNCIAPGCVINTNVNMANHIIINTRCSISHDCIIEDYVTISPGVTIAGNVKVCEGAFIGSGATIIPDLTIGKSAYIAAGTCVTKDVPSNVMVAGVPGKVKKKLLKYANSLK